MSEENLEKNKIENEEKEVVKESNTIKQEYHSLYIRATTHYHHIIHYVAVCNKDKRTIWRVLQSFLGHGALL